eukprot:maker-scaffold628_size122696-snap-gene-0.37 protein:Tk01159 transcript:maker-scaffold628_size122696-snap-gene-0.37-mRNA-1 annotation:"ubiquitin-associated domain-containing"
MIPDSPLLWGCLSTDHILRGNEIWRLFSSKLTFLDTKDAVFALYLLYKFRVYERRLGSRRFAARVLFAWIFSTVLEVATSLALIYSPLNSSLDAQAWNRQALAVGPLGLVFALLVSFLTDLYQSRVGSSLGWAAIPPEFFTFVVVINLVTSPANGLACLGGVISGLALHWNVLWVKNWLVIPQILGSISYQLWGQWFESGPPPQGMIGATLEIQKAQEMEALEQQMIRQQTNHMRNHVPHPNRRPQVGQGFAEQLVNDGGGPNWHQNAVPPSEDNIRMLMDMGFTRDRVENALRQTSNDIQSATALLVQGI